MKAAISKKAFFTLGLVFLAVTLFHSEASPWGFATHAYIDGELEKKNGQKNDNEIYGGLAPDIFNYVFDLPYQPLLYISTHDDFMRLWNSAQTGMDRSLAVGFVSHNDVWGADSTAHHNGITFGQSEGYVIAKAGLLARILGQVPEYQALQLPEPITLMISHEFVEDGIDILMKRADPLIGQRITDAAVHRSKQFSDLLADTYADDFAGFSGMGHDDSVRFIKTAENEFRKKMALYGQALMQDEATSIFLISEQAAVMAEGFLAAYGLVLPPDVDLTPLIAFAIQQSMMLCAGDIQGELGATIEHVDRQLQARGISY